MNSATLNESIEAITEPVCRAHGLELVQIVQVKERGGLVLRVLIDRLGSEAGPGHGVTVADCRAISRDLGPALEVHEVLAGAYRLEVSSPGLRRPLITLKDFERFAGRYIKLRTRAPFPGDAEEDTRSFRGELVGVEGDSIVLKTETDQLKIPHGELETANVVPDFD